MVIDIRTLILVICLSNFLQAFALFIQFMINKKYKGIGWWTLSNAMTGIGFVFFMLRDIIASKLITIIFANSLLILGAIFIYAGIMRFMDKKAKSGVITAIFALFLLSFLFYTFINDDITIRTVIFSITMATILFICAQSILAHKISSIKVSVYFLAGVILVNGIFFALRSIETLIASPIDNFFTPTFFQTGAFVSCLVFSFLWTLGVIIMINQRLNAEVIEAKEHFELIFNTSPDAVLITRPQDGCFVDINEGFTTIMGFTREDAIGKSSLEMDIWTNPADRLKIINELRDKGYCENVESGFKRKDGSQITGMTSAKIITLHSSPHIISVTRDISKRKQMEKLIFDEKELLKTTLLSIGDGVISTNRHGKVELMNKVAEQLTGWTQAEGFGHPLEEVYNMVNEFTRERCANPADQVFDTGNIIKLTNHTLLISPAGSERAIEDSAAPIMDEAGNINGVVLVFRDFTEKKVGQEIIEYLIYHDQLTGLYNRRFYEEEIKRLDIHGNLPITLVMADVNGLKLTNDAFGHLVGDELLRKFATILKQESRRDEIISRIGGDEFVLLLPETDSLQAEIIVNRLRASLEKEKTDKTILSVAFGWATKHGIDEDFDKIYMQAEDNMYRHKLLESTSMKNETIKLIAKSLHEKNAREQQHCERVSDLCKKIGLALGLSSDDVNELGLLGLLHDIGKIGINEKISNKPEKLTAIEWLEIKRHPEIGYQILRSVNEFAHIAEYVLSHHERSDGNGYPRNLKAAEIPLQSKILSVAEAYDTMTHDFPYKVVLNDSEAIQELKINADTQFDAEIARIFTEKVLRKNW